MINNSMKSFQDIISLTNKVISEEQNKNNTIDEIVSTLELAESYLGRKLNKQEVSQFTDVILEAEEVIAKKKDDGVLFKKGKYTIEIMTSDGKLVKSATSQQGILNVIHGERQYRVLDANNRDITAKLKSFIKEKQKQQELKKKYAKKKKRKPTNEEVSHLNEYAGAGTLLKKIGSEFIEGGLEAGARQAVRGPGAEVLQRVSEFIPTPRVIDVAPATPAKITLTPQPTVRFSPDTVLPFKEPQTVPFKIDTPTFHPPVPATKPSLPEVVPTKPETLPSPAPSPAPKPDTLPAPKPEPKPAPKPEPKPAPKPDTLPAPKPTPSPAPKPDTFPAPKRKIDVDTSTKPKTDTDTDVKPKTDTDTSTKPKTDTDTDVKPKTDGRTQTKTRFHIPNPTRTTTDTDMDVPPMMGGGGGSSSTLDSAPISVEPLQGDPKELFKQRRTGIFGLPTNY
jgi:hypothetical protein